MGIFRHPFPMATILHGEEMLIHVWRGYFICVNVIHIYITMNKLDKEINLIKQYYSLDLLEVLNSEADLSLKINSMSPSISP